MTRINIKKYRARLEAATEKLNNLPETAYGWQAEKALNKERRALLDEIRHCESLIQIAAESALSEK